MDSEFLEKRRGLDVPWQGPFDGVFLLLRCSEAFVEVPEATYASAQLIRAIQKETIISGGKEHGAKP